MIEEPDPLPHALGPEKSVLSSLMRNPQLLAETALEPEVFYLPAHQLLYRRMQAAGEVELVGFIQGLQAARLLEEVGGAGAVTDIFTYAPNEQHFRKHLQIIEDCHTRRKVIAACSEAIAAARDAGSEGNLVPAIAAIEAAGKSAGTNGQGFPLEAVDELQAGSPSLDFVEGLLTEGGASVLYGESNVGKSFWILDLAAHVATGKPWRDGDLQVDRGAVVYIALEGTHGLRNRIEAMKAKGILTPGAPLFVCTSPVSLLDPTHGAKLVQTVKAAAARSDLPCRLVVIDTMARAMAGGNENAGEDMTAAVAVIDEVKRLTGAHVCIVHHSGKDAARGARGHSSLRAAVDTELEIHRPEGEHVSTVRVTKQRDIEPIGPMPFSLTPVEIGRDRREKPVTSCVVKHEDEIMAATPKKAGRKASYAPEAMLDYLPAASAKEWQEKASGECGVSRSVFYELKNTLQQRGAYRAETGTGRLVRA